MPPRTRLHDALEFTTVAATTIRNISTGVKVPFLAGAATLTLSIVEVIKSLKSSNEEYTEVTEQIHEILAAIIVLYETTQIRGVVPPALLSDVVNFTETLRKIHVYVKARQGMGRLKRLLNLSENELQVKECKAELQKTLDTFRLQTRISAVSTLFQMQMDANEKHKELMEFLAAHPNIAYSDSASEVSGTFSDTTGSSLSISMLPPAPQIFHGRDSELNEVVELLKQDSPRIAILGPGGIGKTSLARAVLHHADVAAKYSERYFVPCHSSLTSADLISAICSHIGLENGKGSQQILQHFTGSTPALLVLDNFETTWEPMSSRSETEEFLSLLTGVPELAILVTMRGTEHPGKTKWTRPFPRPLTPLSDAAAHQVFIDIAEHNHEQRKVQQLLSLTGNLPLAVSLMANVVGYEGCDRTLSRWQEENTHLLSQGYDQTYSLDISIMLSYSSSRMTHGAQELLSLISMLPDGLSDADLVQSKLPLDNILACKSTLIQVSLAYVDNTKHLKCLVPIREYIHRVHPPSSMMKYALRQYFHQILSVGTGHHLRGMPQNMGQVKDIARNCHNILSDAVEHHTPDLETTINSIAYLNRCLRFAGSGLTGSDLMAKVWPEATKLPSTGSHGTFFREMLMSSSTMTMPVNVVECIEVGNNHFTDAVNEEKYQWYYSLAFLYYRRNDLRQALHWCEFALSQTEDNTSPIYSYLLTLTSFLMTLTGEPSRAITLVRKARQICELVGDIFGQSQAMRAESECHLSLGNLRWAEALSTGALKLGPSELEEICQEHLANIHLAKTEYQKAQDLMLQIMNSRTSGKNAIHDTVVCQLLLAEIGIETGAELEVISCHIESARLQCNTFVVWPLGLIHCDRLAADLHLLQGNMPRAPEFENCLLAYQRTRDAEGIQMVLTRLADIQYSMHSHRETLRWAVVLLAHGMSTKRRGAIVKALRFIGDLLAEDDEDTSLSLFSAALDAFTFMDVHRDKADCMVRIAQIFERRGENNKSVELLQEARPLYERSSQAKGISQIDAKLQNVMPNLNNYEKQLQGLAELNVPVRDLGKAQIEELNGERNKGVVSGRRERQAEGI